MNWDEIEENWKLFNGKVRSHRGTLTDDDVELANGKRSELLGFLQTRYGYAKEQAEREIDLWIKQLK
jgi:uncharacterized protein YjbJ (UPF0337 family)